MGFRELDPVAILRVDDREGQKVWAYEQPESRRILDPKLAYLMNDILSDNNARLWAFSADNKLYLDDRPAAAKTGTTEAWHDSWTVGYTPQVATGVWMGNTDNTPMERVPGSIGAAYVWNEVMHAAHEGLPVEPFHEPPGIVEEHVCSVSGLKPTADCPHVITEKFIAGSEPVMSCNIHKAYNVNKETGKLATPNTPPELIERQVFEIFAPEADDWVREAEIAQPPTEYDDYSSSRESEDVAVLTPEMFGYISELVEIRGNARNNVRFWKLDYGQGLDPGEWVQIGGDNGYEVHNDLMALWDVAELDGLYTLRLTAVGHDDSIRQDVLQVTVDNTPPSIKLSHPEDGMTFVKEDDEWINIQVTAGDNVSMAGVDFFLDGKELGRSTVSPYNKSWTIVMSDTIPVLGQEREWITLAMTQTTGAVVNKSYLSSTEWATRTITNADGTLAEERYPAVQVLYDPELEQTSMWFDGGMGIISDSRGITETHLIKVVAVDAAGNETEVDPVRVWVVHKEEEEEQESAAVPHRAKIWPVRSQQEPLLPLVCEGGLPCGEIVAADRRRSGTARRIRP
jgi:hypothetical protein